MLGANEILMDAFYTDVRPQLAQWRAERGLPADPMRAFAESGYQDRIDAERVGGTQSVLGRLTPDTTTSKSTTPRTVMTHSAVTELIARSNRLGADPKNTNYAGGNTSAKGSDTDPVDR